MDLELHANLMRKHNKRQLNAKEERGSEKQNGLNTLTQLGRTQGPGPARQKRVPPTPFSPLFTR